MRKYVIQMQDNSLHVITSNHTPGGDPRYKAVFPAPDGVEKRDDVHLVEIDINGTMVDVPQLNQSAKDARIAAEATALDAKKWVNLRRQRTEILASTDWTQMPDAPLSPQQKTDWATYRQELRDLPANTVDPTAPTWPTEPS